jgi:hypothetical protein
MRCPDIRTTHVAWMRSGTFSSSRLFNATLCTALADYWYLSGPWTVESALSFPETLVSLLLDPTGNNLGIRHCYVPEALDNVDIVYEDGRLMSLLRRFAGIVRSLDSRPHGVLRNLGPYCWTTGDTLGIRSIDGAQTGAPPADSCRPALSGMCMHVPGNKMTSRLLERCCLGTT